MSFFGYVLIFSTQAHVYQSRVLRESILNFYGFSPELKQLTVAKTVIKIAFELY
jgi:hypothetical protein